MALHQISTYLSWHYWTNIELKWIQNVYFKGKEPFLRVSLNVDRINLTNQAEPLGVAYCVG